MVEQAVVVVEAKQQRADLLARLLATKSADHAVGGAEAFDLAHDRAPAGRGDHAVEAARKVAQPALGDAAVLGRGGEADARAAG